MRARLDITALQVLAGCCIVLLSVLSLLSGQALADLSLLPAMKMARTVLPAPLEHFVAYAGVAAIGTAGYGPSRRSVSVIVGLCVYSGALEYLRHFSPGRHPSIEDFAGSALGALCGGLIILLLWRRLFDQPS